MNKLIKNRGFHLCVIYVCVFVSNGQMADLFEGIIHGFDAVKTAKYS